MSLGELRAQSNCVGIYHLNGNATDASGSGNNGTATNITYSQANGKFGQGAGFNGSSSFIDIPSNPSWTSWHVSFYFYLNSLNICVPISKDLVTSKRTFSLELTASGAASVYAWNSTGTNFGLVLPAATFKAKKIIRVDMKYDSSVNLLSFFLDSKLISSGVTSGVANSDDAKITLGKQNGYGKYLDGWIDELCVFKEAKSNSWIKKQYSLGRFGEL